MKQRTGYIYRDKSRNRWVARVTFTDETGKRRNVKAYCATKTEARDKLDELRRDLKQRGQSAVDGNKLKFKELADKYEAVKLVEAVYVDGRKVGGMRSTYTPKLYVKTLVAHFGNKRVRAITHADIEAFKLMRLRTKTKTGGQRTVAAVNRELETMRAMMNFAKRQGWISDNPFNLGEPLIDRGAERSRERIISFEEEEKLLAQFIGQRAHLRPLVILALDSGMRRGELFTLEWQDVDFKTRTIKLRTINTKTNEARDIAMTDRVHDELKQVYDNSLQRATDSVFGIKSNIKNGWASACKAAEIEGLRLHDLRHSFVSRLVAANVPVPIAMKLAGHKTMAMLNRYLNPDAHFARRAVEALAVFCRKAGDADGDKSAE